MPRLSSVVKSCLPAPLLVAATAVRDAIRPTPQKTRSLAYLRRIGAPTRVVTGPFNGMAYYPASRGWVIVPRALGIYELELHGVVEDLITRAPDCVLDVGSAEGYYAVGLARRLPAARVVCYDTDPVANHQLRRNIRMNDVGARVTVAGFCSPAELQRALSAAARPALVCDCEGFEDVLLDPAAAPALAKAIVLVELHDQFCPGVSGRVAARFTDTHDITRIDSRPRTPADWPAGVPPLPPEDAVTAMDEIRQVTMSWFYMLPKTG